MTRRLTPEILARCVDDVRAGRQSVDACVAAHPAHAAELRGLLAVATSIAPPPPVTPDPRFRLRARVALVEAIHAEQEDRRRALPARLWGLLGGRPLNLLLRGGAVSALVLLMLVTVGAAGGVVYAAQAALPGDTLYPVKRRVETIELALATTEERRARVHLARAARRVDEMQVASERGRLAAAVIAADDFVEAVASADGQLAQAAASGQDVEAVVARLDENLRRQQAALTAAQERAATPAATALAKAAAAAERGLTRASTRIAETREAAAPPGTPDSSTPPTGTPAPPAVLRPVASATPSAESVATVTPAPRLTAVAPQTGTVATSIAGVDAPGESQRGLSAKLAAARQAAERGQREGARQMLDALRRELDALRQAGHLDAAEHASLSAEVTTVIESLADVPALAPVGTPSSPPANDRPPANRPAIPALEKSAPAQRGSARRTITVRGGPPGRSESVAKGTPTPERIAPIQEATR